MADPFTLLPANVARLADLTPPYSRRYALGGVYVAVEESTYVCCATDGRYLALVRGQVDGDPLGYPAPPELIEGGPSAGSAVIPVLAWKEAFRSLPKGSITREQPLLAHVAIHLGEEQSLLVTTDGEEAAVTATANVEGKFPDFEGILPTDEPTVRVDVNPRMLRELARVAEDFLRADPAGRLTLEFRAANRPLVLRAGLGTQEFVGLLMPTQNPDPKA